MSTHDTTQRSLRAIAAALSCAAMAALIGVGAFPGHAVLSSEGSTNIFGSEANRTFTGEDADDALGNSVAFLGSIGEEGPFESFADDESLIGAKTPEVFVVQKSGSEDYHYEISDGSLQQGLVGPPVAGAGDVDNDGSDDFIVGDPVSDQAVVYSGADGSVIVTFDGENAVDWFGCAVAGVGDINGDGNDDVMVGASRYGPGQYLSEAGRVYVFFNENEYAQVDAGDADIIIDGVDTGNSSNERFGFDVSTCNFDGAGDTDLIIAAPYAYVDGEQSTGMVYVFLLSASQSYPVTWDAEDADVIISGEPDANSYFGYALSGGGDFDDDGYHDIIVGAFEWDEPSGQDPNDNTESGEIHVGRAYVFFGAASPASDIDAADADLVITGDRAGDKFGTDVTFVHDVDDDGHDDILIGAPYYDHHSNTDSGHAYLFYGSADSKSYPTIARQAPVIFKGDNAGDLLGYAVGAAGHFNDNAYADLIIGAPGYDDGSDTNAGQAYIFFSPDE